MIFPIGSTPHLIFLAKDHINIGEELSYDYGERRQEILENHPWLASSSSRLRSERHKNDDVNDNESENYDKPDISGNSDLQLIKSLITDYEKNAGNLGKLYL